MVLDIALENGTWLYAPVQPCTRCEIKRGVIFEGKEAFVDPFSLVLQSMATPVSCQEGKPPPAYAREIKGVMRLERNEDWSQLKRAHQYRAAEEAYWRKSGGLWGLTQMATNKINAGVNSHWVQGYEILGPGLTVAAVSVVRMIMGVVVRTFILIRTRGGGLWILGVIWDTALLAISPVHCAVGRGSKVQTQYLIAWESRQVLWNAGKGPHPEENQGFVATPLRLLLLCNGGVCCG
jgi:hypothetical protein